MSYKALHILALILLLWPPTGIQAQKMSYRAFMDSCLSANVALAAERLNIPIAEGMMIASRAYPDPSFSLDYSNNSDWYMLMGRSISMELSQTLELGKRRARIDLAETNLETAKASLEDYLRGLTADATQVFLEVLLKKGLADSYHQSYMNMRELAQGDSLRAVKGEISELDALQSRLEERLAFQEWSASLAEMENALVDLDRISGNPLRGTKDVDGDLQPKDTLYQLSDLLSMAVLQRTDLVLAQRRLETAERQLKLTRRERNPDIDLKIGANYNTRALNEIAPSPNYWGYTVGVSIPLPFSNANRGEIRSSQNLVTQASLEKEDIRHRIQGEVIQAFNHYEASRKRVEEFNSKLLQSARNLLEGKIYAYSHGQTSLLDVISAQHTHNEVQRSYTECLHECLSALVELQRSAGIWDISLQEE